MLLKLLGNYLTVESGIFPEDKVDLRLDNTGELSVVSFERIDGIDDFEY